MKVSIGFCTSDWWVSRIIRRATKATVSHTYIVFDEPGTRLNEEIYEAAWCGFRMSTRAALTRGTTRIIKEIPVAVEPSSALSICRAWLETPYDYLGLVGEAPVQLGKLFGQRWPNFAAGAHHMFCSEAATLLLQESDLLLPEDYIKPGLGLWAVRMLDARTTSPADLLAALEPQ